MDNFINYIGIGIGLFGLIVGYWQNRQKNNFEKLVRANNWYNLQLAFDVYKKAHSDNVAPEVIEHLSRADAFGQGVTKESVRQIHLFEKSFTKADIEAWEKDGKISEALKKVFLQLADKSSKNS